MFKVGDWVKVKKTGYMSVIIDIATTDCNKEEIYNPILDNELDYKISELELWKPKEGEWCWFDKNKLGKFWKKQGTRNHWTLSDFISISEKTRIPSGDYFVLVNGEPFTYGLPSFTKDKQ